MLPRPKESENLKQEMSPFPVALPLISKNGFVLDVYKFFAVCSTSTDEGSHCGCWFLQSVILPGKLLPAASFPTLQILISVVANRLPHSSLG